MFLKRKIVKPITIVLLFCLLFQAMPVYALTDYFPETPSFDADYKNKQNEKNDFFVEEEETIPAEIVGEIIEERAVNEKRFLMSDGSFQVGVYSNAIHYEKNGKFEEIDNTLVEEKNSYKLSANSFDLSFSKDKNSFVLNNKGYELKWSLQKGKTTKANIRNYEEIIYDNQQKNDKYFENKYNSSTNNSFDKYKNEVKSRNLIEKNSSEKMELSKIASEVIYKNVYNATDVKYDIIGSTVKENIILNDKKAIKDKYVYNLEISNLENLEIVQEKANEISLMDLGTEEIIFKIEAPYMYDANLEYSENVALTLKANELIVTVDEEWLNDKERQYPIIIDPTIETSVDKNAMEIVSIRSNAASTTNAFMRVGSSSTNYNRSLLKFTLPALDSGDQVIDARLAVLNFQDNIPGYTSYNPPSRSIVVNVHKITSNWVQDVNLTTWATMANNHDETRIEDYFVYSYYSDPYKWNTADITNVVKDWYANGNNYGVMLKENVESLTAGNEAYFWSNNNTGVWAPNRPGIVITYRNQTGLLEYMSYQTQDIGRITGYTNQYNGNQIFTFPDASTPGNRFPVNISHVWNTNDRDDNIGYGNGWRLNLSQTLDLVTIPNSEHGSYYVFTDEDGTRHYFYQKGSVYVDEDGLGLTMTLNTSNWTFTMVDKDGNKMIFKAYTTNDNYRLMQIVDTSGNEININYSSNLLISSVSDAVGDIINLTYTSGLLTKIIDKNNRQMTYTYDNNNCLAKVIYPDSKDIRFEYHSGISQAVTLIARAINIDGSYVLYNYSINGPNYKPNRVTRMREYSTSETLGSDVYMTYGANTTIYEEYRDISNVLTYTFNNWGQTNNITTNNFTTNDIYGKTSLYGTNNSNGSYNKLILDSDFTKSVNNYILNHSFEKDMDGWNVAQWGNGGATATTGIVTNDNYIGNKSFKMDSNNIDVAPFLRQGIGGLEAGKTYTLSAYIKTDNVIPKNNTSGAGLAIYYNLDGSPSYTSFITPKIIGTNDWQRVEYTFTYTSNMSNFQVGGMLLYATGIMYIDCIQLEEGEIANNYNLVDNNYFHHNKTYWSENYPHVNDVIENGAFKITGETSKQKNIKQMINVSGSAGDIYTISTLVKNNGVFNSNKSVDFRIGVIKLDGTYDWVGYNGSSKALTSVDTWQYLSAQFVTNASYKAIEVYLCVYFNVNEAYFTNVNLFKDVSNTSYVYDNNGNLINAKDKTSAINTLTYDINNQLIRNQNIKGTDVSYTYDNTVKNRLTELLNNITGVKYNLGYNSYGQNNYLKTNSSSTNSYIESSLNYSSNGNFLTKVSDEREKDTDFNYNVNTGTLSNSINANNVQTSYTYDTIDKLSSVSVGNTVNNYAYLNDYLVTISHNGFDYNFSYDDFGNLSKVKEGNQTLITNYYAPRNGRLTNSIYGNNQTISYTYDTFNRLLSTTKQDKTLNYYYDNFNNLARVRDITNNIEYNYKYDLAKRLNEYNQNDFGIKYQYDDNSNVSKKTFNLETDEKITNYTYDRDSKPIATIFNNNSIDYTYDNLDRLYSKSINHLFNTTYSYLNVLGDKTTHLVDSITNGNNIINYTYDDFGNILTISDGLTLTNEYEYDDLNELTSDKDYTNDTEYIYNYDNGGNIISKVTKELSSGTVLNTDTYSYTNNNWKDQLTSFNGSSITYDAIGNPLTYGSNISYSWVNGRELASYTDTSKSLNISYKYNENGIRTEKTVNGIETKYYLEGSNIIFEDRDGTVIYYFYDSDGVAGFEYQNNTYYFVKNLQGDVISILDSNMNYVGHYEYSAFGEIISITDDLGVDVSSNPSHIMNVNPFKYRSYYYDVETELYYLNARYYSPEFSRFINADGIIGEVGGHILSFNMYAYVYNNPVMYSDPSGLLAVCAPIVNGAYSPPPIPIKLVTTGSTSYCAPTPTKASSSGVKFVADYEEFFATPYDDGYGNMTIGYGHLIKKGENFTSITKEQAFNMLTKDINKYETMVTNYSNSIGVVWDQNQYDAFVSLAYNSGSHFQSVMNKINSGMDPHQAFSTIIYSNGQQVLGLYRRRMDEADMFVYGTYNRTYRGW